MARQLTIDLEAVPEVDGVKSETEDMKLVLQIASTVLASAISICDLLITRGVKAAELKSILVVIKKLIDAWLGIL